MDAQVNEDVGIEACLNWAVMHGAELIPGAGGRLKLAIELPQGAKSSCRVDCHTSLAMCSLHLVLKQ